MSGITFKATPLTSECVSTLYDEWADLAHDSIEKNVFLFPWFVRASLQLLSLRNPVVVTIYHDELLIGLSIMQPDRGYARIPIEFYRNCLHYHQFLATPLIRNGHANEFFVGIGNWLDQSPTKKSFCLLSLLSGEGEIARAAEEVFGSEDRPTALLDNFERAAITEPATSAATAEHHISKSRLKNLHRRRRQLEKVGEVSVECFSADDSAKEWLEDFIRLENTGWKREAKTSIAENPIDIQFYQEMIESAEAESAVSFMRLSVNGTAIAYTLDLNGGPFVYCLKSAHDADYRKYAPGVILEHETLKKFHRPDLPVFVDSCTSPKNKMLNELWPHKKKIVALAFARSGIQHEIAFKSVILLKKLIGKSGALKRAGK